MSDNLTHYRNMNTTRMPRKGDRVRIEGFLGEFEIVRVERNGLMVDLKHLGRHGSDYIEKEILTRELKYLDAPKPAGSPIGHASHHAHGVLPAIAASGNRPKANLGR